MTTDQLDRVHGDSLTDEEERVLRLLEGHKGHDAAITGELIAEAVRLEYDRVRAVVSHLVNRHDRLIASCGSGYYIPVTADEVEASTRSLRHRGISILARAARIQRRSLEDVFGQAKLELEATK